MICRLEALPGIFPSSLVSTDCKFRIAAMSNLVKFPQISSCLSLLMRHFSTVSVNILLNISFIQLFFLVWNSKGVLGVILKDREKAKLLGQAPAAFVSDWDSCIKRSR